MLNRISPGASPHRIFLPSHLAVTAILVLAGCAGGKASVEPVERVEPKYAGPGTITAVAVNDGSLYLSRSTDGACTLERFDLASDDPSAEVTGLVECPPRIDVLPAGELVLRGSDGVTIPGTDSRDGLVAWAGSHSYVISEGERLVWYLDGVPIPLPSLEPDLLTIVSGAVIGVERSGDSRRVVRLEPVAESDEPGRTVLVESIGEIDWIAIDDEELEMALSTMKDGSLDIALANLEEPVMNWIPPDPSDEERPRFSPVGYKLSYIIRNPGGDILRTVHVPTAAMVLVDFPAAVVRDYAWLPDGERVLVAVSSPLASDHVVEATYAGGTKRIVVEPEWQVDRDTDRIPGAPPGSLLILPSDLGYGDRRPLVIWSSPAADGGLEFDPGLVPLLERNEVGVVVVNGSFDRLSSSFREAIAEAPWVDESAIWAVGDVGTGHLPESVRFISRERGENAALQILKSLDEGAVQR